MRRTSRIACGPARSRACLVPAPTSKQHFADPEVMKPSPEHAKLDAYYNVDNGPARFAASISRQRNRRADLSLPGWSPSTISDDHAHHSQHWRHRSPSLQCRRLARLPSSSRTPWTTTRAPTNSNMDVYERNPGAGYEARWPSIVASFVYFDRKPRRDDSAQPHQTPTGAAAALRVCFKDGPLRRLPFSPEQ